MNSSDCFEVHPSSRLVGRGEIPEIIRKSNKTNVVLADYIALHEETVWQADYLLCECSKEPR